MPDAPAPIPVRSNTVTGPRTRSSACNAIERPLIPAPTMLTDIVVSLRRASVTPVEVSAEDARRFLAARHLLAPARTVTGGPEAVLEVFRRLGPIQFDPP